MKSNYKLLGDYITRVDVRNKNLETTNLKGLSMTKEFRDSTSNIVGVDLSKYKLVPKNHFACDFMSVIRVHKLPVVHQNSDDLIIVSPAYTVFKVIDETILNPEYLMMWFRRPEFDRYADFRCDSAIRGGFKWEELGEVELPIPSIEKQRDIVKEYNTIVNRIKLNETLNQKLEDTAQALYKHWFVDFNFPNANGKPYKSSGGKMVYNEELDMEIPEGWEVLPISDFCDVTFSKRIYQSEYSKSGIPFYRSKEIILKKNGKKITNELYIPETRFKEITDKFGTISEGDILLTAVGTIGVSYLVTKKDNFYFKDGNLFWFKNFKNNGFNKLIYQWMQTKYFEESLAEITFGSTQKVITTTAVYLLKHINPNKELLHLFKLYSESILRKKENKINENSLLRELKDLLLSKMSKVETKTFVV